VISAPTKEVDLTLPSINTTQVRMREQQALRRAQIDASRIGVGVSQEAQDIFNSLCKTYAPSICPACFLDLTCNQDCPANGMARR
jgi:hypothetical protein